MLRRLTTLVNAASIGSSSTITSRTASSFPVPSSHVPSCRPILAGRGRVKPSGRTSISARISAARQSRDYSSTSGDNASSETPAKIGRGRSKRRLSTSSVEQPKPITISTNLEGTTEESLHLSLTPSHLPLPIPLGVEQYFGQRGTSVNPVPNPSEWTTTHGPFDTTFSSSQIFQGDIQAMVKANGTAFDAHRSTLNDHLHVMYALARPGRSQHLRQGHKYNADFFDSDLPTLTSTLNTAFNAAGARNALAAEKEWDAVLAKFSGSSEVKAVEQKGDVIVSPEERSAVENAVSELNVFLEGLKVDEVISVTPRNDNVELVGIVDEKGEEQWIRLDSTRRKRKKKINKHKFKKRRKAQRALRKRLGK